MKITQNNKPVACLVDKYSVCLVRIDTSPYSEDSSH